MKPVSQRSEKKNIDSTAGLDVDGLIVVVFPLETWNMIKVKADEMGLVPNEVLSLAIKEYCKD
jgi:hypothetical protein